MKQKLTITPFFIAFAFFINTSLAQYIQFLYEIQYSQMATTYSDQTQSTYWEDWIVSPTPATQDILLTEACLNSAQLNMNVLALLPNHQLTKVITQIPPHYQLLLTLGLFSVDVDFQQFYVTVSGSAFSTLSDFTGQTPSDLNTLCINPGDINCEMPVYLTQDQISGSDYCGIPKKDVFFTVVSQFLHNQEELDFNINSNMFDPTHQVVIKSIQLQYFPCETGCQVCTNSSTNCSQCISGLYLMSDTLICVATCPKYYYLDTTQNTCFLCSSNCDYCSDSSTCTTCHIGYYIDSNNGCTQCDSNCYTCQTNPTNCVACALGQYLTTTNTCSPCAAQCSTCVTSDTNCTGCATGYKLQYYGSTFVCQTACNSGYFATLSFGVCELCSPSLCANCIPDSAKVNGKSGCQLSVCQPGLYLFKNECRSDCYNTNHYVEVVDPVKGGLCESCNTTVCYQCITSTKCQTCQNGYYLNSVQWCSLCDTNCYSCTGTGQCTICNSGYLNQAGICVLSCSNGYYVNGSTCSPCFSGCAQCSGSLNNQCSSCSNGYQLFTTECLIDCQPGNFRDIDRICKACSNGCQHCTNSVYCDTCFPHYYVNSITQQCSSCDPSCYQCSGPTPQQCSQCPTGLILFQSACIATCPNTYYLDTSTNTCSSCTDPGCSICNAANQCSLCTNTTQYLVSNASCSSTCPSGYQSWSAQYTASNGSVQTQIYCEQNACNTGFYYVSGSCQEICGDGLLFNYACDDGNVTNGDGCNSTCSIENNFNCVYSQQNAKSICTLQFQFTLKQGSENQIIIVQNTQVSNFNNIYSIQIPILSKSQYSYTITQDPSDSLQLIVSFSFTIQVSSFLTATISISSSNSINFTTYTSSIPYAVIQQTQTQQFTSSYVPPNSVVESSSKLSKTSSVVTSSIIASFIPMSLLGSINYMTKVLDISQLIYIHIFIDIKYPYGTQLFLQSFKDFELPFVPNIFEYMFPKNYEQETYSSFQENHMFATFLINGGNEYTLLIAVFVLHQGLKLIFRKNQKISEQIQDFFIYGFYGEIIMSTYVQIVLACFLQFTNMSDKSSANIFNYIMSVLSLIVFVPMPFAFAFYLKRNFLNRKEERLERELRFFWEGMKDSSFYDMIYIIYIHFRKLYFAFIIVALNSSPVASCLLICIPSIMLGLFVYIRRPFANKYENYKQIAQEIFFVSGSISIASLKGYDGFPEDERQDISIPVILFFFLILLMHFVATIIEMIHKIHSLRLVQKLKGLIALCLFKLRPKSASVASTKAGKIHSAEENNKQDDSIKIDNIKFENDAQSIIREGPFKTQMRRQSMAKRKQRLLSQLNPQSQITSTDIWKSNQNFDNFVFESREKIFQKLGSQGNIFNSSESILQKQSLLIQQQNRSKQVSIQCNNSNHENDNNNELKNEDYQSKKTTSLKEINIEQLIENIKTIKSKSSESLSEKEPSIQGNLISGIISEKVICYDSTPKIQEQEQTKSAEKKDLKIENLDGNDDFNMKNIQSDYQISKSAVEIIPISSKYFSANNSSNNSPALSIETYRIEDNFSQRILEEEDENEKKDHPSNEKEEFDIEKYKNRPRVGSTIDKRKNSRIQKLNYQKQSSRRKSQFFEPSQVSSWK